VKPLVEVLFDNAMVHFQHVNSLHRPSGKRSPM
jgi:hypothetical protein